MNFGHCRLRVGFTSIPLHLKEQCHKIFVRGTQTPQLRVNSFSRPLQWSLFNSRSFIIRGSRSSLVRLSVLSAFGGDLHRRKSRCTSFITDIPFSISMFSIAQEPGIHPSASRCTDHHSIIVPSAADMGQEKKISGLLITLANSV